MKNKSTIYNNYLKENHNHINVAFHNIMVNNSNNMFKYLYGCLETTTLYFKSNIGGNRGCNILMDD